MHRQDPPSHDDTTHHEPSPHDRAHPSSSLELRRRALLGAAAWTAPAVVLVTAAPALAASGDETTLSRTSPASASFSEDIAASRAISVTLLSGTSPLAGEVVTFTLSGTKWLRFTDGAKSARATTDVGGVASTALAVAPNAAPTPGDVVYLVAEYQDQVVVWTITYRPFDTLALGETAGHQVVLAGGQLFAWGYNNSGQVGDGTTTSRLSPVAVQRGMLPGNAIVVAAAVGSTHSLAVTDDGRAWAWGRNDYGQLGDGTTTARTTPVAVLAGAVPSGVKIVAVAAGAFYSIALDANGQVYTWGYNNYGQLGDGTRTTRLTPVAASPVPGDVKTIAAITAGYYSAHVVSTDGHVYGWGLNSSGRLGDGTTTTRTTPVALTPGAIPSGAKITALAAGGGGFVVVLASDRNVYAWGSNGAGQLGDSTTTSRYTPVAVQAGAIPAGVTITSVAAGAVSSAALGDDGRVYSWGDNTYGQLGDGTTTSSHRPVATSLGAIPPAAKVTSVKVNGGFAVALTDQRLTYSWGYNDSDGELGNGASGPQANPAPGKVDVAP